MPALPVAAGEHVFREEGDESPFQSLPITSPLTVFIK